MSIKYVKGDATAPNETGDKIVIHVVNDIGRFGAGFALAVLKRFPVVKQTYMQAFENNSALELGDVQFIKVADNMWFANMVSQHGVIGPTNPMPIQYDALRECLRKVCNYAITNNLKVVAPKFGSGLAGGKWSIVEKLIQDELISYGIDVTIYEL